jgi:hypothetical protein
MPDPSLPPPDINLIAFERLGSAAANPTPPGALGAQSLIAQAQQITNRVKKLAGIFPAVDRSSSRELQGAWGLRGHPAKSNQQGFRDLSTDVTTERDIIALGIR